MTNEQKRLAIMNFNAAVKRQMDDGLDKQKAVEIVATRQPELHTNFLRATHQGYRDVADK